MDYFLGLAIILCIATGINATMMFLNFTSVNSSISQDAAVKFPFEMVTAFGTIGAVAVTVHYSRKTQKSDALDKVLSILNKEEAKDARRRIFEAYKINVTRPYGIEDIHTTPPVDVEAGVHIPNPLNAYSYSNEMRQYIERVRSDFEQIGIYANHGLIDKDAFLAAYWRSTIMSWYALRGNIETERHRRPNTPYMTNFEDLKQQAEIYWKRHFPNATINYY